MFSLFCLTHLRLAIGGCPACRLEDLRRVEWNRLRIEAQVERTRKATRKYLSRRIGSAAVGLLLLAGIADARPVASLTATPELVGAGELFLVTGCGLDGTVDFARSEFDGLLYLFDVGADGCVAETQSPSFRAPAAAGVYRVAVEQPRRTGKGRRVTGEAWVEVVP